MRCSASLVPVVVVLAGLVNPPASAGIRHALAEDFTTTVYRDAANTTAYWDTDYGRLGLPPTRPLRTGGVAVPGTCYAARVDGDRLFVAAGPAGLKLFDITDPDAPVSVSGFPTAGTACDLDVEGDYVYVACQTGGLQVFHMTGAWSFTPAATILLPQGGGIPAAQGIVVDGDYAFVATGSAGLVIVDVSDPGAPHQIGVCDTPGNAMQVAVDGDFAFVADAWRGLQIVDVSAPAGPVLVAGLYTQDLAYDVAVNGDYVYVADLRRGLTVLGVHDPRHPTIPAGVDTPGMAMSVEICGDFAYVADGSAGVQAVDIHDPRHPAILGGCVLQGFARSVAVDGVRAFVPAMNGGVEVLRTCRERDPAWTWTDGTPSLTFEPAVSGNRLYVGCYWAGLLVYDLSNPRAPVRIGQVNPADHVSSIAMAGNYVFAADYYQLSVLDVSNPSAPVRATSVTLPSGAIAQGVAVAGDYLFVAAHDNGLMVFDVTHPTSPQYAAGISLGTGFDATSVDISGNYAYITGYDSYRLATVNIANPRAPALTSLLNLGERVWDAEVFGNVLFAAVGARGLLVLDITNPASPSLRTVVDTPHLAYGLERSGNTLIVCDYDDGVLLYDITHPLAPVLMKALDTPGSALKAVAYGDCVYVADYGQGIRALQLSAHDMDPTKNIGRSLAVDNADLVVRKARLTTSQVEQVTWNLSADGGAHWETALPDGAWRTFANTGNTLLWRSTHTLVTTENPVVTDLELDWLYEEPIIDAVADVGMDGGGQVRVRWTRSSHDFTGDAAPVLNYAVYRLAGFLLSPASTGVASVGGGATPVHPASPAATWELVGVCPARCDEEYAMVLPTLADSSGAPGYVTTFYVSALTAAPSVHFDSPPEGGWSVDNTPSSGGRTSLAGVILEPMLRQNVPNPIRGATTIPFALPADTRVASLRIFDLRGRLVRELDPVSGATGELSVRWDGRDAGGRHVSPGVYFCRLVAGDRTLTRRMVLLE